MYVVTGGTSGVGDRLVRKLFEAGEDVLTVAKDEKADFTVDFRLPFNSWADGLRIALDDRGEVVDGIINCAGVNLLASHRDLGEQAFIDLFRVNALSQFYVFDVCRDYMVHGSPVCSIVSDAAWTPMTHSAAYNASKAAQHMIVRQMAHEERDYNIFGIAPGKIADTGMSAYIDNAFPPMRGWTFDQGREYQLKGLKTGEMKPEFVAGFIMHLLENNSPHLHGHIFPIGG